MNPWYSQKTIVTFENDNGVISLGIHKIPLFFENMILPRRSENFVKTLFLLFAAMHKNKMLVVCFYTLKKMHAFKKISWYKCGLYYFIIQLFVRKMYKYRVHSNYVHNKEFIFSHNNIRRRIIKFELQQNIF